VTIDKILQKKVKKFKKQFKKI